jgi:recombination protein RecA
VSKETQLEEAKKQVKKQFGAGAVMVLSQHSAAEEINIISTGNKAIDDLTGIGGIPRGRICEVYGPEAGGKTTLCLQIVAQAQKLGGLVLYLDAEHSLDIGYARALGVDVDKLMVSQPDCGEDALEIALTFIRSGAVMLVVVDSVAALVPRAELEGDMGDSMMGLQARLMSQAMRKLNGVVKNTDTSLVFINQTREKIGVMFGSPETTTGGKALKFYSTLRLDCRRISQIKKGDVVIGQNVKLKSAKNKLSAPYRDVEIALHYGKGFIDE